MNPLHAFHAKGGRHGVFSGVKLSLNAYAVGRSSSMRLVRCVSPRTVKARRQAGTAGTRFIVDYHGWRAYVFQSAQGLAYELVD